MTVEAPAETVVPDAASPGYFSAMVRRQRRAGKRMLREAIGEFNNDDAVKGCPARGNRVGQYRGQSERRRPKGDQDATRGWL